MLLNTYITHIWFYFVSAYLTAVPSYLSSSFYFSAFLSYLHVIMLFFPTATRFRSEFLRAWALMFVCLLHWTMCSLIWCLGWTIALSIKSTPERPLGQVVISSSFTFIAVYHKHALKDASPVSYIQLIKHQPEKKKGTACNKFARLLSFLIILSWCFGCVWGGSVGAVFVCVQAHTVWVYLVCLHACIKSV